MGPFGMDRTPDFPAAFSEKAKMSDMKHFVMEPNHENTAVDSFLGLGMENMGISSKMDEFSHGFDFSFLPDYGGLDSCSTQDMEAGLNLEILDGFLDEVEDIYASKNIAETEVKKKKVSELDGGSSESFSPGISRSIGLSEWSKETVPHVESQNLSSGKVKDSLETNSNDMQCLYESEDDKKPLSTFISSRVKQGKNRTCTRLLDSFDGTMSCVSYDFRPRKGPLKKYIHTAMEKRLSDDDEETSSESEDEIGVRNRCKSKSDRRKQQRMWSVDEVVKLVDGISHFGVGKWTDIKNLFFHSASHRTPIDIRDKWRNLLKASYTYKHNDGEAGERRRSGTRPIPKDILHRVKELASLHPYPLSKSLCFLHDSSRSRSTSRRKKKRS